LVSQAGVSSVEFGRSVIMRVAVEIWRYRGKPSYFLSRYWREINFF
jgi:hypothetical protein